jgi:hypothetical protein
MSAFLVSKTHIDLLVHAGLTYPRSGNLRWADPDYSLGQGLTEQTADITGQMLWDANRRSVNHRYRETEVAPRYTYEPLADRGFIIEAACVFKALSCYDYQACEVPDWERTQAFNFCAALRELAAIWVPRYESMPWGIDKPGDVVFSTMVPKPNRWPHG